MHLSHLLSYFGRPAFVNARVSRDTPLIHTAALVSLAYVALFSMADLRLYLRPETGAGLALLLMLPFGSRPWRELLTLPFTRLLLGFIAFLLAHAVYSAWTQPSTGYSEQLTAIAKLIRLGILSCVIGWWLSFRPHAIPWLLALMPLGLVLGVVYHLPWGQMPAIWAGRIRPEFGNSENLSGMLAATGAWLSFCFYFEAWRRGARMRHRSWPAALGLFGFSGCFCVLLLSQSRGAWLALAVVLPWAAWGLARSEARAIGARLWLPAALTLLVSLVLLTSARDMLAVRFAGMSRWIPVAESIAGRQLSLDTSSHVYAAPKPDTEAAPERVQAHERALDNPKEAAPVAAKAVSLRLQLYELAIERLRERPWLGWGLRSIPSLIAAASFDSTLVHLHNAYLDALVGIGLIGSAFMLALFVSLARELKAAWRRRWIPAFLLWAVAGGTGVMLVANLFDSMLWRFEHSRAPLELFFGCCIAYALIGRRAGATLGPSDATNPLPLSS